MSTNLDRIETWARSLADPDDECAMEQEGVMCWHREDDREHAADVLALIEVARAASHLQAIHNDQRLSTTQWTRASIEANSLLNAALSRLENHEVAK